MGEKPLPTLDGFLFSAIQSKLTRLQKTTANTPDSQIGSTVQGLSDAFSQLQAAAK